MHVRDLLSRRAPQTSKPINNHLPKDLGKCAISSVKNSHQIRADRNQNSCVQMAKAEYIKVLSREHFKWFITLTFKKNPTINESLAENKLRHFYNVLNRKVYGRKHSQNRLNTIRWVSSLERNSDKGLHFHLLVCDISELARINTSEFMALAKATWVDEVSGAGYISRCELIRNQAGSIEYITKEFSSDYNPLDLYHILRFA